MIDKDLLRVDFGKVLDKMDFEKIHAYMVLTNWKYSFMGKESIPTIEELRNLCWELFYNLNYKEEHSAVSSGGFMVTLDREDIVSIYFIIEDQDNLSEIYKRKEASL